MRKAGNRLSMLVVACSAALATPAACADSILIGPEFGAYKVGQPLTGTAALDLGPCGSITLWNGSAFRELIGPYKGSLGAYQTPKRVCYPEVSSERETVYDRYFRLVCEQQHVCDAVCTAAFKLVTDKTKTTLKCQ